MVSEKSKNESDAVGLEKGIERLETRRDSKEERRVAGELKGQRARGWTERLLTRTLSGVVYVVLIVACIWGGTYSTAGLLAAMGWVCCSEFFRITRMAGRRPSEIIGLVAAIAFPIAAALAGTRMVFCLMCVLLIAIAIWYVLNPRANMADAAMSVFGPLYTSVTLSCIALIRTGNDGLEGAIITLVVIGSVWVEDSFAYLVGSAIGKHKMAPRTSPNKSWEGFFGGLVGAVAVWVVAALFHVGGLSVPLGLACGFVEGLVAVMGDLFESRIKRSVGVKDSGNLLPGHGGLLDRTDSMLFGGVVAYFVLLLGGIV
ncbi:MAG: phosphatidate cytidylyltransferase [Atopobiaceae bacterium]|nr:phosphatidate cytidylyltransferase [Atopobiaceae bacterium]